MKLTFVTGNAGKVRELAAMLEPLGYTVNTQSGGYPELQASTLAEVTDYGADRLMDRGTPRPFLLEDSGLFVPSLGGFPGVYSRHALDSIGIAGLCRLIRTPTPAYFETDLLWVGHERRHFAGRVDGQVMPAPRGTSGFGFDSVFVPDGQTQTFAEMGLEAKNRLSHRGKAVRSLVDYLRSQAAKA